MKFNLRLLSVFCLGLIFSCSNEQLEDDPIGQDYFRVTEYRVDHVNSKNADQPCFSVDLMAGQHMNVGTVSISKTDTDLVLTYSTIPEWTIGTTHVSIGDCNEQWVPTTKKGNPKIGKFGHKEPHSADINKVVYLISLEALPEGSDLYCFAAHAEVNGPNGEETAWAGNDDGNDDDDNDDGGGVPAYRVSKNLNSGYTVRDFGGRSWATYIEALQSACD